MRRIIADKRAGREQALMVNYISAMVAQGTRSKWIDERAEEYKPDCFGSCPGPLPKGYPCPCSDWERYQSL